MKSAAYTTVRARGLHLACRIFYFLGHEGCNRAPLNTLSARDADGFLKRLVTKGTDFELIAPIRHVNSVNAYDFSAGPNAYAALDALVGIEIKKRITGVNRQVLGYTLQAIESLFVKTNAVDQRLKAA
jgi:hypothetical protein